MLRENKKPQQGFWNLEMGTDVIKIHGYIVNGCCYHTKERDAEQVNQNSGLLSWCSSPYSYFSCLYDNF